MSDIEKQIFEDINFFPNKMKILILGTFPVPLYSQKEKFNSLPKDKKENAWYYASNKSEFWRLIADSFDIDNKEFLINKNMKKKLFKNNKIGIADVFSKCKRKNKDSSKDTDLIIVEYKLTPFIGLIFKVIVAIFIFKFFIKINLSLTEFIISLFILLLFL